MSDPFDVLRLPIAPLQPDERFAADLRARLEAALGPHRGGPTVTRTTDAPAAGRSPSAVRRSITPYLAVVDARRAIDWYAVVLGARLGEHVEMPDGRIGHAELEVGSSFVFLADEHPDIDVVGPTTLGGTSVTLVVDVDDVDATARTAVEAGARLEREPTDQPYGGRNAVVRDPFGHRWIVERLDDAPQGRSAADEPEGAADADGSPGDITYVTLIVDDEERAARFFGELLGWTFSPGRVEHGLQYEGSNIMGGMWGSHAGRHEAKLMYQVADIAEGVRTVRRLGGTATDPELQPYGWSSECTDDQGMEFWIYAPASR